MQTLEKNISHEVMSEIENVATVGTRVHNAVSSAMFVLIIPRMELDEVS